MTSAELTRVIVNSTMSEEEIASLVEEEFRKQRGDALYKASERAVNIGVKRWLRSKAVHAEAGEF
jgi:hypothetical protein